VAEAHPRKPRTIKRQTICSLNKKKKGSESKPKKKNASRSSKGSKRSYRME
tara:strand:+ start:447 stop:599 length:153 start_codon:yes stop_codon:yes gene_type:complete